MTLLLRQRRRLGLLIAGIVLALLVSNLVPDPLGRFTPRRAIPPEATLLEKASIAFGNIGPFLNDNFGFRASMPALRRAIRDALASPDSRPIYAGRDGQLFWGRDFAGEQSAGALVRTAQVERFVAMVEEMARVLGPRTKIVVAIPPNAQTVEREALPAWMDALEKRPTEYDLAAAQLARAGITVADLRAPIAALPRPRYRLTDTHWNARSDLAGFNAMVAAAGHRDWQVDEADVIGPLEPAPPGDLIRTARGAPQVQDRAYRVIPPRVSPKAPHPALRSVHESPAFLPYVIRYRDSGPRVLILGDSFTDGLWPRLFVNAPVSEVAWLHYSARTYGSCDFDFRDVERFAPDLLVVARVERFFPCPPTAWPLGLPRP